LKQEKLELVYQGNHLQRKKAKEKGMGRKKFNDSERKRSSLASIARKKGMMMNIVGNCTQRRDQSGSKRGKGGKKFATTT
jgi:hypothetical protein